MAESRNVMIAQADVEKAAREVVTWYTMGSRNDTLFPLIVDLSDALGRLEAAVIADFKATKPVEVSWWFKARTALRLDLYRRKRS